MTIRVLMDACLLVKGATTNIFLDVADIGLIELHWTTEIEDEVAYNWTEIQLAKDYADRVKAGVERDHTEDEIEKKGDAARNRLANLEALVPQWRVPSWNYNRCIAMFFHEILAAETSYSFANNLFGNSKLKVDLKDRHVALAATQLARAFPNDTIWLATENGDDLLPEILSLLNVYVLHQSLILEILYDIDPHKVRRALEKTIVECKTPTLTKADMVSILRSSNHIRSPILSDHMRAHWGV